ncbi:SDR family NAD(P)-dependent oxidoreductase [Saccharopolyspora sp. NPDC000995]
MATRRSLPPASRPAGAGVSALPRAASAGNPAAARRTSDVADRQSAVHGQHHARDERRRRDQQRHRGVRALPAACNVSHWDQWHPRRARLRRGGRVDVLVNNAGLLPHYPSPDRVSEALWDKVLAVGLKGPFRLADRHPVGRGRRRLDPQRPVRRRDPPRRPSSCPTPRRRPA